MTKAKKMGLIFISLLLLAAISVGVVFKAKARNSVETVAAAIEQQEKLSVNAKSGLLMDFDTGTIVFEQNADERMPIASMVKIMTLTLCFEEMQKGELKVDSDIVASSNATSMGGSQAFLDTGASYKLDELLKTIIVASANDSCVAIAEHISGSVEEFVIRMNEKAKNLGMENTNFANCTGLPSPNGYSSAKDVALMTKEMLKHDAFYDYSTVWMFDLVHPCGRITELSNTNKLTKHYNGCDGGKTGFTNEAKYCLSATAKRGQTRLISVVMGAETSKVRNGENSKLFNYGFANYETRLLVDKGENLLDPVVVAKGKQPCVNLLTDSQLHYFGKKGKLEVVYNHNLQTLKAPVAVGQEAGELAVTVDGVEVGTVKLVTENAVGKKSYLDYLNDTIANW